MAEHQKRSNFSGSIGFVLAAAGSAVGLGNIWRFPYLAAKNGGGVFLLCYLILALTFGFALLTTEIAIGRKTQQSSLTAYKVLHPKFGWLGVLASLVPAIILPYYCAIGGWILKYLSAFLTDASATVADGYFTGFITSQWSPILWFVIFLIPNFLIVYRGVNAGIEKMSRILMPILIVMIIAIAGFSLTLKHTDAAGVTRTGLDGFMVYVIPNFDGIGLRELFNIIMDAAGQLFYSISVAMGIMITYGSYVKKDTHLITSVNQIEIFDTLVAFMAGMMIIPAVFTFSGTDGLAASGPSLMFVSLPKVFDAMGALGTVIGIVFFIVVAFAALTSSVSIMEAIVSGLMDKMHLTRKKATIVVTLYAFVFGAIVCLGYNIFYFELKLPNGSVGQVLDVMDYVSNNILMPVVSITTCILVGWIIKPKSIIDEVTSTGCKFGREKMYVALVKVIVPVMLCFLLMQAVGLMEPILDALENLF